MSIDLEPGTTMHKIGYSLVAGVMRNNNVVIHHKNEDSTACYFNEAALHSFLVFLETQAPFSFRKLMAQYKTPPQKDSNSYYKEND